MQLLSRMKDNSSIDIQMSKDGNGSVCRVCMVANNNAYAEMQLPEDIDLRKSILTVLTDSNTNFTVAEDTLYVKLAEPKGRLVDTIPLVKKLITSATYSLIVIICVSTLITNTLVLLTTALTKVKYEFIGIDTILTSLPSLSLLMMSLTLGIYLHKTHNYTRIVKILNEVQS